MSKCKNERKGGVRVRKIAVISDTHGLLREEVKRELATCEAIFHAGDIDKPEGVKVLRELAPLYVVRGNADKGWAEELQEELTVELYGFRIYMVHNKKHLSTDLSQFDITIYGHSHKYEEKQMKETFFLNPGSCGPRRFHQEITMAILLLDEENHTFTVQKLDYSPTLDKDKAEKLPPKDLHRLITQIIKEIVTGKTVEQIAKKHRVKEELVDQICRIYTTHPGVDVEGILNRMEIWGK